MKKIVITFLVIAGILLCLSTPANALTYGLSHYTSNLGYLGSGGTNDPLYNFINEYETGVNNMTLFSGTSLTFPTNGGTFDNAVNNKFEWNENSDELIWTFGSNTVTVSSGDVTLFSFGTIPVDLDQIKVASVTYTMPTSDGTNGQILQTNGSGVLSFTNAGAGNTLDTAYDQGGAGAGKAIDVSDGAVALSNDDADANPVLTISHTGAAAGDGITITLANGSSDGIEIENTGTGYDIEGTGALWYAEKTGALTAASITATTATFTTLYKEAVVAAAAGDVALTIDAAGAGTITIGGTSTGKITTDNLVELFGATDIGDASTDTLTITSKVDSDLVLDDDTTDSPALTLRDAGEATCSIVKVNGATANTTLTTSSASASVQIVTGNLKVGGGTEDVTLNGNDGYVTGTFEVDGTTRFDADMALNDQILATMGDNTEEVVLTTAVTNYVADSAIVAITSTGAGATNNTYLLRMQNTTDGDAQDHFFVCEDNAGNDKLAVNSGGTITSTLDAASLITIDADTTANTTTGGIIDWNVKSATANNVAMNLDYELDDGGSGTQYGLYIDLDDDCAGGDETFKAIYLANSAGTSATMIGLDIAATVDTGVNIAVPAGGKAIAIDAATIDSTFATGVLDIDWDSKTASAEAVNIKATHLTGGSGQTISALEIELDADSSNASDTLRGIYINASDITATGFVDGIYIGGLTGVRAALQADFGYIRIGTGSTPDVTPGDDDLYVEGTIEVDGAARFDGAITANSTITGDGGDALGGFKRTVTNDTDGKTLTIAESMSVQTNAGAVGAGVWTLPEASTAIGVYYTFVVAAAQQLNINPADGADTILYSTCVAGDSIQNNTVGGSVTIVAIDNTNWAVIGSPNGTWTDAN